MSYITRRAESLYNNSTRIFDIEKTKAAAETASKAKEKLISNADGIDGEN